jgi:hypothetical protein
LEGEEESMRGLLEELEGLGARVGKIEEEVG